MCFTVGLHKRGGPGVPNEGIEVDRWMGRYRNEQRGSERAKIRLPRIQKAVQARVAEREVFARAHHLFGDGAPNTETPAGTYRIQISTELH